MIEISLALLIIGLTSSTGLYIFRAFYKQYCIQLTKKRQQVILRAIGEFASRTGHVPYPIDVKDTTNRIAPNNVSTQSLNKTPTIGLVPWQALGIPEENIYDGYGNLMTYIMDPLLGARNDVTIVPNIEEIFELTNTHDNDISSYCHINTKNLKHGEEAFRTFIVLKKKTQSYFRERELKRGKDPTTDRTIFLNTEKGEEMPVYQVIDEFFSTPERTMLLQYPSHKTMPQLSNRSTCLTANKFAQEQMKGRPAIKLAGKAYNFPILAIISHGTTGGHFHKGKRTALRTDSPSAQMNTHEPVVFNIEKRYTVGSSGYKIMVSDPYDKNFDHIVAYSTRFGLSAYGGPRCRPIIKQKHKLLQIRFQHTSNDYSTIHAQGTDYTYISTTLTDAAAFDHKYQPHTTIKEPVIFNQTATSLPIKNENQSQNTPIS